MAVKINADQEIPVYMTLDPMNPFILCTNASIRTCGRFSSRDEAIAAAERLQMVLDNDTDNTLLHISFQIWDLTTPKRCFITYQTECSKW